MRGTRATACWEDVLWRFIPACAGNTAGSYLGGALNDGSSPRVRGTPRSPFARRCRQRFIPACAGNTNPARSPARGSPVHPRVCGEHRRTNARQTAVAGSSPRVRGTHIQNGERRRVPAVHPRVCGEHLHSSRSKLVGSRFIPACAGNTAGRTIAPASTTVHPRVCGEHERRGGRLGTRHRFIPACAGNTSSSGWKAGVFNGSSPRVRGTRHAGVQGCCGHAVHPRVCGEHRGERLDAEGCRRFIPACAGNTPYRFADSTSRTVHPRVCGEHGTALKPAHEPIGSSPRVRGTRRPAKGRTTSDSVHPRVCGEHELRELLQSVFARFIPACAGNTPPDTRRGAKPSVHPRVCGEHLVAASVLTIRAGSSPRVRGTLDPPCDRDVAQRFIPACAGNTRRPDRPNSPIPVHPRVCGEHTEVEAQAIGQAGSSPRVRGTLPLSMTSAIVGRFIPACAGNTLTAS